MRRSIVICTLAILILTALGAASGAYVRLSVTGTYVNIRAEANTRGKILAQANPGDTFIAEDEPTVNSADGSSWYRIVMSAGSENVPLKADARFGVAAAYISANFVNVNKLNEDEDKAIASKLANAKLAPQQTYLPFSKLSGVPDNVKKVFPLEKLKQIVNQLENHYADMFRDDAARERLCLYITKIGLSGRQIRMEYALQETSEGDSLRTGVVSIEKNKKGWPVARSDVIVQETGAGNSTENYTASEGFKIRSSIKGEDFDIRLPKVTHSKNSKIGEFYDSMINEYNLLLLNFRIGDADFEDWERLLYEYPEAAYPNVDYVTRRARGLVSVQIIRADLIDGLAFDDDGKIYTNEDIFKIYGMTRAEAEAAIMASYDEPDVKIQNCYIFSEDTIFCNAYGGGDFSHGYLITSKDGRVYATKPRRSD